jgi:hypothetical protein
MDRGITSFANKFVGMHVSSVSSFERFYRWRRNPLAAKPPYPKPSKPFYPAYLACIIPPKPWFVKPS